MKKYIKLNDENIVEAIIVKDDSSMIIPSNFIEITDNENIIIVGEYKRLKNKHFLRLPEEEIIKTKGNFVKRNRNF